VIIAGLGVLDDVTIVATSLEAGDQHPESRRPALARHRG
jgi:hypothetical protein